MQLMVRQLGSLLLEDFYDVLTAIDIGELACDFHDLCVYS